MKLKQLFSKSVLKNVSGDITVNGISDDTRTVAKGDIFFIIERKNFDIYSRLKTIEPKVKAFVSDVAYRDKLKGLLKHKPIIFVNSVDRYFLKACDLFYGFNKNDFKFIGITGTNGKTTTAYLIYHLLQKLNKKAALIGTVKYCIGTNRYEAPYTTPDVLTLRKFFKKAKSKGVEYIVMEVSSHSVCQERTKGIIFSRLVFTNLSPEHLDYHKTMDKYFSVKKSLFLNNRSALAIINLDDAYGRVLSSKLSKKLSYGIKSDATFKAEAISLGNKGSVFSLKFKDKTYPLVTSLIGNHNIDNILAAVATTYSLGFNLKKLISDLKSFRTVKGRLEKIREGIFIDYAHTPDALKKVLGSLKQAGYSRIILVFGCGGDRDKSKRVLMGKIASGQACFSYVTSDNPRSEKPMDIALAITRGFKKKNYSLVLDRKKAIAAAVKLLNKERQKYSKDKTALLIAGKGHENYQIIGNKKLPFSDSQVVRKIIKYDQRNI